MMWSSGQRGAPEPAEVRTGWEREGESSTLRLSAGNLRDALSLPVWGAGAVVAVGTAAVARYARHDLVAAVLAALIISGLAVTMITYMRLVVDARTVVIRIGADHIELEDGRAPQRIFPLDDLTRFTVVHDGAPSAVRIVAGGERFRWTIGQLYRHNRVEEFIGPTPEPVIARLARHGIVGAATVQRGVRTSDYRVR